MDRRVIYRPVSISPSLSLSLVLSLLLSETEISDSSLNCLRKALALSSSLVLKPKNSSPSASDAIIMQGYGNLLTHFRRPIVKHITIRTYLVFCVKRNIGISWLSWPLAITSEIVVSSTYFHISASPAFKSSIMAQAWSPVGHQLECNAIRRSNPRPV